MGPDATWNPGPSGVSDRSLRTTERERSGQELFHAARVCSRPEAFVLASGADGSIALEIPLAQSESTPAKATGCESCLQPTVPRSQRWSVPMLRIYRIHALTNGDVAMKASRLTIDDALREAKFLLGGEASVVWIDDKDGNPILPADQIRARVAEFGQPPQDIISRTIIATTP